MELINHIIGVLSRTLDRVWNEFILDGDIASIFFAFGFLAIAIMIVCWGELFPVEAGDRSNAGK